MTKLTHIRFGSGENILFLHGWGGNSSSLSCFSNALKNEFATTCVDFSGEWQRTFADYVDGVKEIIDNYRMDNVTIIGHSFGGKVALALAIKYPYIINKLILLAPSGIKPRRGLKYKFKIFYNKIFKSDKFASSDYNALSPTMKKTFVDIVNTHLDKDLSKIPTKTLLIWGNKDKETPIYMAYKLRRKIVNSRLVIHKGGHFSYLENYPQTLREIIKFIGE